MTKAIIVAADENNGIGKSNGMPWHIPSETRYFMETTMNHIIIMGHNSYMALGKPLKNRLNLVISHQKIEDEGVIIVDSLEHSIKLAEELLEKYPNYHSDKIFITGGGMVYKEALEKKLVDYLYFTRIHGKFDCDVYFPKVNWDHWTLLSEEKCGDVINNSTPIPYTIQKWLSKHID